MQLRVNRKVLNWSRLLHIYAAVALLLIMAFFAVTGIALNHPDWLPSEPLEQELNFEIEGYQTTQGRAFTPAQTAVLEEQLGVGFSRLLVEQDGELLFFDAQFPGGFVSAELDGANGSVVGQRTGYGTWAWLNDLHKGRHSSDFWKWIIDISGVLTLLFCITGFVLLIPQQRRFGRAMQIGAAALLLMLVGMMTA